MDLNVRNYDEYLANIQIFKRLEDGYLYYESNVCDILYERCLRLLPEIFLNMKISNLQRVAKFWSEKEKAISVDKMIHYYAEIMCEHMIGEQLTKRTLLEFIICDMER